MAEKQVTSLYFSPSGTTKLVTQRLAACFAGEKKEIDLLGGAIPACAFGPDDLLVAGFPVFAGRLPNTGFDWFERLSGESTPVIAVVVYGNRAYEDALVELSDRLEARGFRVIGAAAFVAQHSIFPKVAQGRPDAQDYLKIDLFGRLCAAKLGNSGGSGEKPPRIKGNRPYRELSHTWIQLSADKNCTACGACAVRCPVQAIDPADPRKTDPNRCISCTACIAVCPRRARRFHGFAYRTASAAFPKRCAARLEPEYFI